MTDESDTTQGASRGISGRTFSKAAVYAVPSIAIATPTQASAAWLSENGRGGGRSGGCGGSGRSGGPDSTSRALHDSQI